MSQTKFKVVMIGDSNVGKTSIIDRYVEGVFPNLPTVGVGFKSKSLYLDNKTFQLQIWDINGA